MIAYGPLIIALLVFTISLSHAARGILHQHQIQRYKHLTGALFYIWLASVILHLSSGANTIPQTVLYVLTVLSGMVYLAFIGYVERNPPEEDDGFDPLKMPDD